MVFLPAQPVWGENIPTVYHWSHICPKLQNSSLFHSVDYYMRLTSKPKTSTPDTKFHWAWPSLLYPAKPSPAALQALSTVEHHMYHKTDKYCCYTYQLTTWRSNCSLHCSRQCVAILICVTSSCWELQGTMYTVTSEYISIYILPKGILQ